MQKYFMFYNVLMTDLKAKFDEKQFVQTACMCCGIVQFLSRTCFFFFIMVCQILITLYANKPLMYKIV